MKIRTGFVSNSSSSSFLLVGIEFNGSHQSDSNVEIFNELLKKLGYDNDSCLSFGYFSPFIPKTSNTFTPALVIYGQVNPLWIGLANTSQYLSDDSTVSELRVRFINTVIELFSIELDRSMVNLYHGEAYDS